MYCQQNRSNIVTEAERRIADSERTHINACTSFNTLVQYGGDVTGWDFEDFEVCVLGRDYVWGLQYRYTGV